MCVIIQRDPGIKIPEENILSAVHVNSDGWGLVITDRGKVTMEKGYDPTQNLYKLAEFLNKRLDDAKDCQVALHTRFTTAGERNVENAHPYHLLKKDEDGVDLYFMHNGTLGSFRNVDTKMSDTYNFGKVIAAPLLRSAFELYGPEEYLFQPYIQDILKEFKGSGSAFTFNDSEGNLLILPSGSSKQHEGWWSSNTYSFDRFHRTQSRSTVWPQRGGGTNGNNTTGGVNRSYHHTPTNGDSCSLPEKPASSSGSQSVVPFRTDSQTSFTTGTPNGTNTSSATENTRPVSNEEKVVVTHKPIRRESVMRKALADEAEALKQDLAEIAKDNGNTKVVAVAYQGAYKPRFCTIAGIKDTKELLRYDFDALIQMAEEHSEATAILIMDLLWDKYGSTMPNVPIVRGK